jgi:hypothetical protein
VGEELEEEDTKRLADAGGARGAAMPQLMGALRELSAAPARPPAAAAAASRHS